MRSLFAALLIPLLWVAPAGAWGRVTVSDEAELARKFQLLIESRFAVVEDTVIQDAVQRIVDRLLSVMPPQPFPVQVRVVEHPSPNAFASAGGQITVFTGLIAHMESEDELAGVLAHELAHVSERHVAQAIERSQYLSVGALIGMLAGAFLGASGKAQTGEALMMGSAAGAGALAFQYSRDNEHAADQLGFAFLVDAGFEPAAMPRAFGRMRRLQWLGGGGGVPSYLSTHPALEERMVALEERVARLPQHIQRHKADSKNFTLLQTLVRAQFGQPETAQAVFRAKEKADSCLAALGQGIAAARLHQNAEAEAALRSAMACPGVRGIAARELGRLWLSLGQTAQARRLLQEAQSAMPQDVSTQVLLSQAHADEGNAALALELLQPALKRFPRSPQLWQLASRLEAALGRESAAHIASARAFAVMRRWEKAAWHRDRAASLARTPAEREALSRLDAELEDLHSLWRQLS
jgi:predicted Zn-dependent protease